MQVIKLKPDYLYIIVYQIHKKKNVLWIFNGPISNIFEHFNVTIYFSYAASAEH